MISLEPELAVGKPWQDIRGRCTDSQSVASTSIAMLATRTPLATNERDVRGHARHAELVEVAERVDDVNQGLALPRAEGLGGRRPFRSSKEGKFSSMWASLCASPLNLVCVAFFGTTSAWTSGTSSESTCLLVGGPLRASAAA